MTTRIKRGKNAETGEIYEVDIPKWEIEIQMDVRAKRRAALFAALAHVLTEEKAIPPWLAEAICSDWGRSVMTNIVKEAETAVNPRTHN